MGEHLYTYVDPPSEKHLNRIERILADGAILAMPMGSSWAFCCDATSRRGILGMYALKPEHPKNRPFSLICNDISMASSMANIGPQSYRLLKKAWPGGYTFILRSSRQLPKRLKDKRENVGIRIPNEEITLAVIQHYGKPLAATTVPRGRNGEILQMGYQVFDEFGHALAMVIDVGNEL
ncbi:MAG: Sua5/YciO/YrdC/YwlC family protein, partial [Myxococcota bacterium]|nr:Sua5/YciO/YrdC/YwlC family protein [Myxococcota bacterium]